MRSHISQNRTFLMGLAMIAIVCFHHGWIVIPGFTAVFSRFGLWGVDVFLFLSGFGCVYALNRYTTNVFLCKRIVRLLPTCILAGVLVYCMDLYFHAERTITYIPIRLLSIQRWYIQAILVCYCLCPLAFVILKRARIVGLLCMIASVIVIENILPEVDVWKINWAFGRMPVFLIGMYVAMFDLTMSLWKYIISGICLIMAIVIRCGVGNDAFKWTYFLAMAIPLVCVALCRLRNLCIRFRVNHFIELLGTYSLEIYLIHEYLFWAIYEVQFPLWCKYIIFIIAVFGLCFSIKKIADYCQGTLFKAIYEKAENSFSR